ncbi:hypothetical protein EGO51_19295, partial [Haloarcula hispanica]
MKTVGAGATVAAGASHTDGTALDPVGEADALVPLAIGAAVAGAAIGAYLHDEVSDRFADSDDLTGYTGSDALHAAIVEKAVSLQTTQEQVLSSLENTAKFADNAAIPKGMAAVVESFNAGESESVVQNSMEAAIDEYYAGVQTDILNAYSSAKQQMDHWHESLASHSAVDGDTAIAPVDVLAAYDNAWKKGDSFTSMWLASGVSSYYSSGSYDVSLSDGSTYSIPYVEGGNGVTVSSYPHVSVNGGSPIRYGVAPVDYRGDGGDTYGNVPESERIEPIDIQRFRDLWTAITDSRDRVYSNLSTFVSDVMAEYEPGEIDLSNYVSPMTAYAELSSKDDDLAYAGAAAAMLGIPRYEQPMTITIAPGTTDEYQVFGSIYSSQEPDGGFAVGTTYDPSSLSYPVFMRYEYAGSSTETATETPTGSSTETATETPTGSTAPDVG